MGLHIHLQARTREMEGSWGCAEVDGRLVGLLRQSRSRACGVAGAVRSFECASMCVQLHLTSG